MLISVGALGHGHPAQDLIVSPQHRIFVGGGGQLLGHLKTGAFVTAKTLTSLHGIRHMKGSPKLHGYTSYVTVMSWSKPMLASQNRSFLVRWY
ncbi:Type I secretion target repeat protein [Sulfitobacter guttiformis KCTC 32187]|nr:Type I secretion target repeat protein [Sulfitobacter guttiformis KCTC 32187]